MSASKIDLVNDVMIITRSQTTYIFWEQTKLNLEYPDRVFYCSNLIHKTRGAEWDQLCFGFKKDCGLNGTEMRLMIEEVVNSEDYKLGFTGKLLRKLNGIEVIENPWTTEDLEKEQDDLKLVKEESIQKNLKRKCVHLGK